MSTPDLTDADLEARIRAACRARADGLPVVERPFEPGAAAERGLPTAPPAGGRSRVLLAAAAVVVVGALAAGVVLLGADDGTDQIRTGSTSTPVGSTTVAASTAEDWLAPSSPPLGLELRSVTWKAHRPIAGFELRAQLFEPGRGGGHVMLIAQPGSGGGVGGPGPSVHGQPSTLSVPKTGDARITWNEGDVVLEAEWRDMDQDAALALVEQLVPREADRMAGFDVPADGSVRLVAEAEPDQVRNDVELTYGDGGDRLTVQTSVSDAPTYEMVEIAFSSTGPIEADGSSVSFAEDAAYYQEVGPGQLVTVDGGDVGPSGATEAQLADVAASVRPISEAGLLALERDTPGADLASAPPATTSTSPDVTSTTRSLSGSRDAAAQGTTKPLERLDGGGTVSIAELADGRPVVVLVWATWCVPCIQALEEFDRIAASHPGSSVVAVAVEGQRDEVRRIVDGTGITIPVLLDPDRSIDDAFEAVSLPWTVMVEPDGFRSGAGPAGGTEGPAVASNFLDGAG